MRNLYLLLIPALLLCLASCQKSGGSGPTDFPVTNIAAKWNLQTENLVQYVNGVQQIDTTYSKSATNTSYLSFDGISSFTSVSHYVSTDGTGTNLSGGQISAATDSVTNTYTYDGTTLHLATIIPGFLAGGGIYSFGVSTGNNIPIITLQSHNELVTKLTSGILNIHEEYVVTNTTSGTTITFKNVIDYFYTK